MDPTLATKKPVSMARRLWGSVRIVAGLLVLVALVTQIIDKTIHHAIVPSQYFMYFSIQSSFLNVAVLLIGGVLALRSTIDGEFFSSIQMAILVYAIITALVYNTLLRGIPLAPGTPPGLQWPIEVMHVWIPIVILADWLFAPGRARLAWASLRLLVTYPLVWALVTIVRGLLSGWYPYPFLEPSHPGGWFSVLGYVLGIAVLVIGLGSAAIALSRRPAKLSS